MTHSTAYDTLAVPKGATFTREELALLAAIPTEARRAALNIVVLPWLDTDDDDSFGSALIVIGEKPSDYVAVWEPFKACVRLLRRGPIRR